MGSPNLGNLLDLKKKIPLYLGESLKAQCHMTDKFKQLSIVLYFYFSETLLKWTLSRCSCHTQKPLKITLCVTWPFIQHQRIIFNTKLSFIWKTFKVTWIKNKNTKLSTFDMPWKSKRTGLKHLWKYTFKTTHFLSKAKWIIWIIRFVIVVKRLLQYHEFSRKLKLLFSS